MKIGMKTAINIARAALAISFAISLYFLLPYIAPLAGADSFVVISDSMAHEADNQAFLESFWSNLSVPPGSMPFRYGFRRGDLLLIAPGESYAIGDVVVFQMPGSQTFYSHRIYKMNATDFRDIGDNYFNESDMETGTMSVHGSVVYDDVTIQKMFLKPDFTYQGPRLERMSHYWMPQSYIKGRALVVLPGAGLLRNFLEKPAPEN
jgi:hypothetical protein